MIASTLAYCVGCRPPFLHVPLDLPTFELNGAYHLGNLRRQSVPTRGLPEDRTECPRGRCIERVALPSVSLVGGWAIFEVE